MADEPICDFSNGSSISFNLVDLHGHQLHHVADRAGRLLADRDAAGQHRILDGSAQTDLLAADVADIGRTAADEVEYLAEGRAGDLGDLLEAEAQKCAGVAGQAFPRGAVSASQQLP